MNREQLELRGLACLWMNEYEFSEALDLVQGLSDIELIEFVGESPELDSDAERMVESGWYND